jgi:hypothetical protein
MENTVALNKTWLNSFVLEPYSKQLMTLQMLVHLYWVVGVTVSSGSAILLSVCKLSSHNASYIREMIMYMVNKMNAENLSRLRSVQAHYNIY